MNRWTVLSKRGGVIIDWPEYDKRRAVEWMDEHKEMIGCDSSFMAGAKLVLMDIPTEAETLNARIKELENKLEKARKRVRELEARLREKKDPEEIANPFAIKKENWRIDK
jgi:predicted RNase H-like nuclease (RuvC/YqgF family)